VGAPVLLPLVAAAAKGEMLTSRDSERRGMEDGGWRMEGVCELPPPARARGRVQLTCTTGERWVRSVRSFLSGQFIPNIGGIFFF
jgi:hypothetical protein